MLRGAPEHSSPRLHGVPPSALWSGCDRIRQPAESRADTGGTVTSVLKCRQWVDSG
ncbi:hypothetical protein trd_A0846 (plasmid) [Thermomicrobium roseum DSM 5159]|uniref:Uncharacterized protein n=1 Tax=Thermomicrobium roseum (strain ATCC 27502 / DSM 5159 / P-2) TaxID=309801 RepID=B9L4Y2_THERP|nr:hypothetical protein trd_A0846 [Thermomicrobium roseum DSM 5159]